jgi:hypothetical protein
MESFFNFVTETPTLFIYAFVLLFILGVLERSNFQGQIVFFIFTVVLFLFKFGHSFNYKNIFHIMAIIIFLIFFILVFVIVHKIRELPDSTNRIVISYKPILVTVLFIGGCILGVMASYFRMPSFTGYILVTASFFIGLFLYRKEFRFRKQNKID